MISTESEAAGVPLNVTENAPVRLLPVMVTTVPASPPGGVKELMAGVGIAGAGIPLSVACVQEPGTPTAVMLPVRSVAYTVAVKTCENRSVLAGMVVVPL